MREEVEDDDDRTIDSERLRPIEDVDAEPLRSELREVVELVCNHDATASALVRWLGFDGEGGMSVGAAARESGLPSVALRELWKAAPRRLRGVTVRTSALARAIAVVGVRLPATLPRLADALQRARLTSAPFDVRGLVEAARFLAIPTSFVVERGDPPIITHAHVGGVRNAVNLACWHALRGCPVALVVDAMDNLAARTDVDAWRKLVLDLIDAADELAWVDGDCTRFAQAGWVEAVVATIGTLLDRAGDVSLHDVGEALAADPLISRGWTLDDLRRIALRIPDLEVDDDRIHRATARAPVEPVGVDSRGVDASPARGFGEVDEAERRTALVEVLQVRPDTTLHALCSAEGEVGRWLRSITVADLARVAIEAGVGDPAAGRAKPATGSPSPTEAAATSRRAIASRSATGTGWSGTASSLSIRVGHPPMDGAPPAAPARDPLIVSDGEPAIPVSPAALPDADASCDFTKILDVIRRGPPYGVSMTQLEGELPIPRSRLRQRLRQLETRGAIVRNGLSRSTRYASPRAARADDEAGSGS